MVTEKQVCTYRSRQRLRRLHETVTIDKVAERIAEILDYRYGGECALSENAGARYLVPDETLSLTTARQLGLRGERDLFGGIVPYEFVATKVITHPLVDTNSPRPVGFRGDLSREMESAVLSGYSAFSQIEANRAGQELLRKGPIRLKPSRGKGGSGQIVVQNEMQLSRALAVWDFSEIDKFGMVLEENLSQVTTCSVGFVTLGAQDISYYGVQTLTPNNHGGESYGGSSLVVARGGAKNLFQLLSDRSALIAGRQAIAYDQAALKHYPDIIASRRNYDVAQGIDADGNWRSGVLEQSWRVGGASPAEIAAFEFFKEFKTRNTVRALCVERYGDSVEIPKTAQLYFSGVDQHAGPLTKYAMVVE